MFFFSPFGLVRVCCCCCPARSLSSPLASSGRQNGDDIGVLFSPDAAFIYRLHSFLFCCTDLTCLNHHAFSRGCCDEGDFDDTCKRALLCLPTPPPHTHSPPPHTTNCNTLFLLFIPTLTYTTHPTTAQTSTNKCCRRQHREACGSQAGRPWRRS